MAKLINGLLGNSKNKIGSIVTYVSKGQQIARAKAANISNPRTSSQMTQRIKLSNVVAMYRANRGWMDRYAFETKPTRWSVFNAFVSANLSSSLVALTKQEVAAGAAVVAPYRMTDGTLPEIHVNENTTTGLFETDLYVGTLTLSEATTIGELSAALIANNNGLVNGMQLSLVENFQNVQNNIPRITTRAYEMIIDTTSTALVSTRISSESFVTGGSEGAHILAYNGQSGTAAQGVAFVLSHTVAGKTYVSPSVMTLTDPATYESYISSAAVDLAIASYGSTNETPFLDSTEVAASVSGDVTIAPSILQFAGKNPSSYLGSPSSFLSAANDTILLLSQDADVESVIARVQGTNYTSTSVTPSDSATGTYIVEFDNTFAALTNPVVAIVVNLAGGSTVSAPFADADPGITE